MPTFFDIPDIDTSNLLKEMIDTYHDELNQANVNVGIIVVRREGKDGEGRDAFPPANARVRPTPRKYRLHCEHDAIIEICHHRWNTANTATKKALLDHELTHLLVMEKEGAPMLDDLGRPRLKLRKDEIELTAFTEVIARHGSAAIEWRSISNAYTMAEEAMAQHPENPDNSVGSAIQRAGDVIHQARSAGSV